jgi:thiamine-phosphate pyrophosphorylase
MRSGADYLGFGHMFPTSSKLKETPSKTIDELHVVCQSVSIPVIAIGGITALNAKEMVAAGASGIAVIAAFCKAQDPLDAATELSALMLR